MSLSWENEQPFAPKTSFDVSGKDVRLSLSDAPTAEDETRRHYEQIINSSHCFKCQEEDAPVHYVPPARQPVGEPVPQKRKKKCWLLRPLAWLVFILSVGLMNSIINTTFLLIDYVVKWLSTLPTIAIILLAIAFGSFAISLMITGTIKLVAFVVSGSHTIYPSKKGARFYIIAAVQVFISFLSIVLSFAATGAAHTFWDFAAPLYFIIVYIGMMCGVRSLID